MSPRRGAASLGILVALAAVASPPAHLVHDLFSAHMVQHLVLILMTAPLLAFGVSPALVRARRRSRLVAALTHPGFALALHSIVVWVWHAPGLYDAALANDALHAFEHALFVVTGVLFWAPLVAPNDARYLDRAPALLYLFVALMQSGALGAILTFAGTPLYDAHLATTAEHGSTPLEDQQLAGIVMWVPAGVAYTGVAAVVFVRWLRAMDRTHPRTVSSP